MSSLLQHCQQMIATDGGLYAAVFTAGLVGSVTHCTGMCGPFVATQVTARLDAVPAHAMREWHRLQGAALLPYHIGRLTTYATLGALAGGFSSLLFASPWMGRISALLLVVAGALFLLQGFGLKQPVGKGTPSAISSLIERSSNHLWLDPTGVRGYALGIMLGFLPCGLVMAALLTVATTGSAASAALGMALFGLGTVPALLMVGLGSHALARRWRKESRVAARVAMMFNGLLLCFMAAEHVM